MSDVPLICSEAIKACVQPSALARYAARSAYKAKACVATYSGEVVPDLTVAVEVPELGGQLMLPVEKVMALNVAQLAQHILRIMLRQRGME